MKVVIVTGGRHYSNKERVYATLDILKPDLIVNGGAKGADTLANQYALDKNIKCRVFEADWEEHGKSAGPIRNKEMLEAYINATVVAFEGGKGTKNCVEQAIKKSMMVINVKGEDEF